MQPGTLSSKRQRRPTSLSTLIKEFGTYSRQVLQGLRYQSYQQGGLTKVGLLWT